MSIEHAGRLYCPQCGLLLNLVIEDGDVPPTGAAAFCYGCGKFSIYQRSLFGQVYIRVPSEEEMQRFVRDDPSVPVVLEVWDTHVKRVRVPGFRATPRELARIVRQRLVTPP